MKYTVEKPGEHTGIVQRVADYFGKRYDMDNWYRISEPDGSTVAYVLDGPTAALIARCLEEDDETA